jgi:ribosomal protein S12 methylthiotransferase
LRLIERIRSTVPGVSLRTSFIAGFPGETEADFRELADFVRAAEFDWMGVFAYSDVDSAASHALDDKIAPEVIAERRDKLMAIQRRISARRLRRFKGRRLAALVEGPSKDNALVWEARLEGMAPEIDGKVYLTDLEPPEGGRAAIAGNMATVEITETHDYDLVGRVVEVRDSAAAPSARTEALPDPMPRIATGALLRVLA